jgi:16S rRNA (guanine(527)-N(7))-methyltransferase RsmG
MQASVLAHQRAAAGAQAASTKQHPSCSPEVGGRRRGPMVGPLLPFAPARALFVAQHHHHHHAAALVAAARLALSAVAASSTGGHRRTSVSVVAAASTAAAAGPPPPSAAAPPSATLVDAAQRERLASFLDHLLLTNESMNLTAVRDRDEAWTRHVEDSLALVPVIERWAAVGAAAAASGAGGAPPPASGKKNNKAGRKKRPQQAWFEEGEEAEEEAPVAPPPASDATPSTTPPPPTQQQRQQQQLRLIDVGTGPGLPGMILAIARPHWRVTLLDSLRKRCDFLRAAASRLELTNVDVVWSRAEDAGRQPLLRDAHDVAVARAVAETRVLAELCLPFVRPGGVWVAAKGAAIEGEVEAAAKAIAALKGRVLAVEAVDSFYGSSAASAAGAVETSEAKEHDDNGAAAAAAASAAVRRTAIVVEKLAPTPPAYPRPPGTPNKKPL